MKLLIPIHSAEHLASNLKAATKMELPHRTRRISRKIYFEIEYDSAIEVYYFGANVAAEGEGFFKSPLTTKTKSMKHKLLLILLLTAMACTSQKTVEIPLDYGALTPLISTGELFKPGSRDVYFYWGDSCGKQGYIVFNLNHEGFVHGTGNRGEKSAAYLLLDSLDTEHKMRDVDLSLSNWDSTNRAYFIYLHEHFREMLGRFNTHVFAVVNKEALSSGIDYDTKLIYK